MVVVLNNSAGGGNLAGALARELSAIAMEAGEEAPETTLPWTIDQAHEAVASAAKCPID